MISRYPNLASSQTSNPIANFSVALARLGLSELELSQQELQLAKLAYDSVSYTADLLGWDELQFLDYLSGAFQQSGIQPKVQPTTTTAKSDSTALVAIAAIVVLALMSKE